MIEQTAAQEPSTVTDQRPWGRFDQLVLDDTVSVIDEDDIERLEDDYVREP